MSDPEDRRSLRRALRTLLRTPLLRRAVDPEGYDDVRRRLEPIVEWFAETTGWGVEHDRPAGIIRLRKVPARDDATHRAAPDFSRRHYTLLCLLLAELDRAGRQVTLQRMAEHLRDATAAEVEIRRFDATVWDERRAFVQIVRWLIVHGVLGRRDGDEEGYVAGGVVDALYDVDDRALALLLACPRSPSSVEAPAFLVEEFYAETDDGRRKRLAQHVFRRLLDEPVIYYEDLDSDAREWLNYSLRRVLERLDDVGLSLERRLEGVAPIDPEAELCDTRFPVASSTASHAALLLAEWLTGARTARMPEVEARIAQWQADAVGRGWKHETPREITQSALDVLVRFQLVAIDGDRVHARPAIARYRAADRKESAA